MPISEYKIHSMLNCPHGIKISSESLAVVGNMGYTKWRKHGHLPPSLSLPPSLPPSLSPSLSPGGRGRRCGYELGQQLATQWQLFLNSRRKTVYVFVFSLNSGRCCSILSSNFLLYLQLIFVSSSIVGSVRIHSRCPAWSHHLRSNWGWGQRSRCPHTGTSSSRLGNRLYILGKRV